MDDNYNTFGKLNAYELASMACCVGLMAACSWISIPAAIPFTMQTFGVFMTSGLLGGRKGSLAVLVYLILGAFGLPVFSGFSGGLGYLLGATGGYIIGFQFAALTMWAVEKLLGRSIPALAVSMAAGLIVCYAFGTLWYVNVYLDQSTTAGILSALSTCVLPFVVPDCIKIALACIAVRRLRPVLRT